MRKLYILTAFILTSTAIFAQQPKKTAAPSSPAPKNNQHIRVFEQALTAGDVNTAVSALNYYIIEQGEKTSYTDTLAMLYLQQGSYAQCYYWADKRLAQTPDNVNLMELKGICLDKLQEPKAAIEIFEKLYKKTNSPYHAYKLMELQYSIKRLAECLETALSAEKLTYKPEYLMTYTVGQQTGRTYLQAGVYNIHALALYDLDKKEEAKQYFEKALALDSTFLLAKQNLEAIKTIETGGTRNNNPAPNKQQPVVSPANKTN